jgi:ELWxxDGT repeat protein
MGEQMGIASLTAVALTCVAMFEAQRAPGDSALFVTDGTSTRQVLNTASNPVYDPGGWFFTNAGSSGSVVFSGYNAAYGRELWSTNGKPADTRILRDIHPGQASSSPGGVRQWHDNLELGSIGTGGRTKFQKIGRSVVFPASAPGAPLELWQSDGTGAGTKKITAFSHVSFGLGGTLFANGRFGIYSAYHENCGSSIWATFGNGPGQCLLRDIPQYSDGWTFGTGPHGIVGSRILFGVARSRFQHDLFVTDGTPAGTRFLRRFPINDLVTSVSQISGASFAIFGVSYPSIGHEPWVTDGTPAGTKPLKNLSRGNASTVFGVFSDDRPAFFKLGAKVVFPAVVSPDGVNQQAELWLTDGTTAGTVRYATISRSGGNFHHFAMLGGKLYFTADVYEGSTYRTRQLFVTDGTAAGTKKIATNIVSDGRLVSLPNMLLFTGFDLENPSTFKIWRITPTNTMPVPVGKLFYDPSSGWVRPKQFQAVNIPATNGVHRPCVGE